MKKKKKISIIVIILLIIVVITLLIMYLLKYSNKNALTLNENKWIESNKFDVIDIAVLNDLPIVSYDGQGIVYDFFNYIQDNLELKLNTVAYKLDGSVEYDYKMNIVDTVTDNDIVLYKDNMILVGKNLNYISLDKLTSGKIGVLKSDLELIKNYFASTVEFVEYDTYTELKNSYDKSIKDSEQNLTSVIDGILIPKIIYSKELITNSYNILYQFDDIKKYIVLSMNNSNELKSIFTKQYNVWKDKNLYTSYYDNLLQSYYTFNKVTDLEQKKLQSKNYVYGFVNYGIYNNLTNSNISGINSLVLKDFNKFSKVSITYTKYNSISKLLKDFNDNKVDFMLNITSNSFTSSVYYTENLLNDNLVIVSGKDNREVINNLTLLKNREVSIVKDSYLEEYLNTLGAKVKSYNNLEDLIKEFDTDDITLIELSNYDFYKSSAFKDSRILYINNDINKYNFVVNDNTDNLVFEKIFNFYISYISIDEILALNYSNISYQNSNLVFLLFIVIIILGLYVILDFSNHLKIMFKKTSKKTKVHLSKSDKIKYIDELTSLKNRAYFNSKIEQWDDSKVYPKAIIVIDLNNISYINDNYGREEGDKVITEAANILIMGQLQNSEIIRTDGNEFLIYLVGYDEKQIIAYLRKLVHALKNLSHGFGAASGYSIITDEIKNIDDAVNEATLEMKNNKEDSEY